MTEAVSGELEDSEYGEIVAFLRRAEAWPGETGPIEVVETHFAWVFLGRRHAYKLKKPMHFHAVDFSTVEKRRRACETEVALNRRLAEAVYLAAVPLVRTGGTFVVEGMGPAVEWLVKMRRLDSSRALDRLAREGSVDAADMERLVRKLDHFHRSAARVAWRPSEYRARLVRDIELRHREIAQASTGNVAVGLERLVRKMIHFTVTRASRIEDRIRGEHVVDGHGDLRPEHVFLTEDPQIIDCIEFSAELRMLDAAEEIAFLELECDRLGHRALGIRIAGRYFALSGNRPDPSLYAFYRACRALGRAQIASWRLAEDLGPADRAHWSSALEWYVETGLRSCEA